MWAREGRSESVRRTGATGRPDVYLSGRPSDAGRGAIRRLIESVSCLRATNSPQVVCARFRIDGPFGGHRPRRSEDQRIKKYATYRSGIENVGADVRAGANWNLAAENVRQNI
jgi:hypothetical protein